MDQVTSLVIRDGMAFINGRQVYWYSPREKVAWNSCEEWTLTLEQIAVLETLPGFNADIPQPRKVVIPVCEKCGTVCYGDCEA